MNIQPIVEGDGEVLAVPVLLRRLIADGQCLHARRQPSDPAPADGPGS